jgi:hypothetical protein
MWKINNFYRIEEKIDKKDGLSRQTVEERHFLQQSSKLK